MNPIETLQDWNHLIFGGFVLSESLLWFVYPKNDFLSKAYLNRAMDKSISCVSKKPNLVQQWRVYNLFFHHALQNRLVESLFESLST